MKRAAGVALAVAFVLGGCTSTVAPTPTPASTPSPRPSPTDDGVVVLRFALAGLLAIIAAVAVMVLTRPVERVSVLIARQP